MRHQDYTRPPWRTPTNEERRAQWAAKYYLRYKPHQHPQGEQRDGAKNA